MSQKWAPFEGGREGAAAQSSDLVAQSVTNNIILYRRDIDTYKQCELGLDAESVWHLILAARIDDPVWLLGRRANGLTQAATDQPVGALDWWRCSEIGANVWSWPDAGIDAPEPGWQM